MLCSIPCTVMPEAKKASLKGTLEVIFGYSVGGIFIPSLAAPRLIPAREANPPNFDPTPAEASLT